MNNVQLPRGCKVANTPDIREGLDDRLTQVYLIDLYDGEITRVTRTSKCPTKVWHNISEKEYYINPKDLRTFLMFTLSGEAEE